MSSVYSHDSFIRGYHAYQDIWDPVVGEILEAQQEPYKSNPGGDDYAVRVFRQADPLALTVGHIPRQNSCTTWHFLRRGKVFIRVDGEPINRGFGNGLEVSLYSAILLYAWWFLYVCIIFSQLISF